MLRKHLRGRQALSLLVALTSLVTVWAIPAQAAEPSPFERSCRSYDTGAEFVKQASVYCLRSHQSPQCDRAAKRYFDSCGYEGDYHTISARVHSKMLFMFVLARAEVSSSQAAKKASIN